LEIDQTLRKTHSKITLLQRIGRSFEHKKGVCAGANALHQKMNIAG